MVVRSGRSIAGGKNNQSHQGPGRRDAASLCVAIGLVLGAIGLAHAQEPAPKIEEVLVTGSRIVRRDLNAPSPILTIGTEVFEQNSSVAIETVLNQYPQFNPGATQFTTGEIQPTATTSPGASTLNMRGLGPQRSLVLIDGRRAQPINAAMTVDVNTIPQAAIGDVEVISGGAAATYGPDAMAGVVNFKLKRNFEGVAINYQTGTTQAGDGGENRADVLIGGNFNGGRGNAMFDIGYAHRDAAWQMNRDFFINGFNDPNTPANYPRVDFPYFTAIAGNLPSQTTVNQVLGTTANQARTGDFYVNPTDGQVFRLGGALGYTGPRTFPYKIRTNNNNNLEEGSPRSYASTPLTRYSAFGRAVYELTDSISVYAQGSFVKSDVKTVLFPTPLTAIDVPRNPAIEPAELRTLLDSRLTPGAPWRMSRIAYWFPNRASSNDTKLDEFIVGANGKFLKDWTWDAYTSYGETTLITDMDNFVWLDHYNALVKQPNFGKGGTITQTAANSAANTVTYTCTSGIPIFEPWILGPHGEPIFANNFKLTNDCVDAITANMSQKNTVEQRVTEADFQGKIVTLRAGEVRAAFGISSRKNSSVFEPDELFLATVPAAGETEVNEFYTEFLVPIIKTFDLEIGARASAFQTGDFHQDAKSSKFLFNWTAGENWRVRGGWQRANRTPNVAELYSGPTSQVYTWSQGDACRADTTEIWGNVPSNPNRAAVQNLCAALIYRSGGVAGANLFDAGRNNFPSDGGVSANVYRQENVGNPKLRPEEADTYTAGMVWSPRRRDLSLSVDFYQIEVRDVIDVLGFRQAYLQCFNANGNSNPTFSASNAYCQAIFRDPDSGAATYVQGGNFNFSKRFTSGVDISMNWRKAMLGGEFGINSSINDLITWKQPASSDPDAPLLENAGYESTNQGYFKYRLFTQFSYNRKKLGVGLNWRYLPEQKDLSLVQTPTFTALPTKAYNLFNVNVSYRLSDRVRVRGGMDNLLNKEPPVVGANPNAVNNPTANLGVTNAGDYDVLGRRMYVGLNVSF